MRKKLLSLGLVLAMVLSLMPATVWAANEPTVAQIKRQKDTGGTETLTYPTLEKAFEGALEGDTIQLTKSIDVGADGKDITLAPKYSNITLDLNNKSINLGLKSLDPPTLSQLIIQATTPDAGLTIKGGAIQQGKNGEAPPAVVVQQGTVTIDGANTEIKGNTCGVRVTGGNLVVASGAISGGTAAGSTGIEVTGGNVTVKAGSVTGGANGITFNGGSKLEVTGGTIKGSSNGIQIEGGTLYITGGTIEATGTVKGAGVAVSGTTTVSIIVEGNAGNRAIQISGPIALHFGADSTIKASVWNGTFTGKGTGGKSILVEGTVTTTTSSGTTSSGFIRGGQFVVRDNQNQIKKDPLPGEYLAEGAIQDSEGVVSGCEAEEVVITFDASPDGEFEDEVGSVKRVKAVKDSILSELPKPTLEGYKFAGWYLNRDNDEGGEITSIRCDVDTTVYAHWKELIPITFNANGGTLKDDDGKDVPTKKVEIGDGDPLHESQLPANPTRKDKDKNKEYTFIGWYKAADGEDQVITAEKVTEEEEATVFKKGDPNEVYAHWGYTITFDADGGTLEDGDAAKVTGAVDETSEKATLSEWPANPEKKNNKFDDWYTDKGPKGDKIEKTADGTYEFDKPVTLYAHWIERKDVTLTAWKPSTNNEPANEPAELIVGNNNTLEIILKATGSDFVKSVNEEMFSFTLNGVDGEPVKLSFKVDRTGDTEVTITLDEPLHTAGTLTITVDESAFETPPTKNPWVDIPVVYAIEFNANDGTFEDGNDTYMLTVKEGDVIAITHTPVPKRDRYQFTGWYTKSNPDPEDKPVLYDKGDIILITSESIEDYAQLYAGWRQVIFNVKFDANGGSWADGKNIKDIPTGENSRLTELPQGPTIPPNENFDFDDWYTKEVGGERVTKETEFTKDDTVVYAHWAIKGERTITFYANSDGKDSNDGHFEDGETKKEVIIKTDTLGQDQWPPDPILDKHVFVGWFTEYGEKVTTGYRFIDNTNVYAHWRIGPPYDITFEPNGGKLFPGTSSTVKTTGTTSDGKGTLSQEYLAPERNPSRDGYVFKGWYTEREGGELVTTDTKFDGIATIYARWGLVITFDLNYETGEGTNRTSTVEIEVDKSDRGRLPELPADPTRDGWYFDGWYTEKGDGEGELVTTEFPFVKATTVYAHWTEKEEYTVTFDANGGSVTPTSARTRDGKLSSLPTPTRDGYQFDGWFTAETGGDQVKANETVFTSNATVYAHWTEKPDDSSGSGDGTGSGSGSGTGSGDSSGSGSGSGTGSGTEKSAYAVKIASGIRHGTVSTSHTSAEPGTLVTLTVDSDSDYIVDRVEVVQENGQAVSLNRSGKRYSFTMPASDVTADAKFSLMAAYNTFVPPQSQQTTSQSSAAAAPVAFKPLTTRPAAAMWDVPANSWAYPAAQWAYQNGYLDTTSDKNFRLDGTVSHIQMWRIMAWWMGERSLDDGSVTQWARKNGAVKIGSASSVMTRQNMVEYLYQCYFLMGGDVSATGNLIQYRDGQQAAVASAKNAWLWAVNKGIISGTTDGYLNPNKTLTRGEFAAILMRLCQKG